jgi:putative transposase
LVHFQADLRGRLRHTSLELATLSWVHWFNHDRLHSHCGDIPPVEFEAAHYAAQQTAPAGVGNQ